MTPDRSTERSEGKLGSAIEGCIAQFDGPPFAARAELRALQDADLIARTMVASPFLVLRRALWPDPPQWEIGVLENGGAQFHVAASGPIIEGRPVLTDEARKALGEP